MTTDREFVSCDWIEGGLVFGQGLYHVCCIAHHENRGWMPIAPFDEHSPLPLDAILRVRDEVRRENQFGGHERCRGCVNLRTQRWAPGPAFQTLNFSHFTRCNLKCSYCYLQRREMPTGPREAICSPVPVLREMIRENALSPHAVVHWGGGEPTLLEDFEEILLLLGGRGCTSIVNTNGTVYSAVLCDALANGTACITCSIDAGTPTTYARLKGRDCFDQVLSHLGRYAETAPQRVTAKYLFLRENLDSRDLVGFVQAVSSHGIRQVLCDIDEGLRELPTEMVGRIADLMYLSQRAGIAAQLGGCGALRIPELGLTQRVAAALACHGSPKTIGTVRGSEAP